MPLFRNKHHSYDPVWHVQLTLILIVILQLLLPNSLVAFPRWLIPALVVLCGIGLQLCTPHVATFTSRIRQVLSYILIGLVAIANVTSLQLLLAAMLKATHDQAPQLLLSATAIYFTNMVVFALLYWEMDDGGPGNRRKVDNEGRDFLFPQQDLGYELKHQWFPTFFDYLYVSLTNGTAFSPTDTMPLTRRAKFIMGLQALISLIVVVLIAARAINIL
jgi:uncharacterized membrane protein